MTPERIFERRCRRKMVRAKEKHSKASIAFDLALSNLYRANRELLNAEEKWEEAKAALNHRRKG